MKKYCFPVVLSLFLGVLMAYFIINQYNSLESITVSKLAPHLYYVEAGEYSTYEEMIDAMKDFSNYIYNVQNNMYYTYIGISQSKDNAIKIQEYYKGLGYETSIIEKIVSNDDFIRVLSQYDNILSKTDDPDSIKVICQQVLAQAKEYVNGEYKNKKHSG